jgi:hypothetical protein
MDSIGPVHDRNRWALVNVVINFWVPYNAQNFLVSCGPVSFSGRTLLHGVSHLYHYFRFSVMTEFV